MYFPTIPLSRLYSLCERFYAQPETFPLPQQILVFGCFFTLGAELAAMATEIKDAQRFNGISKIFEHKLDAMMSRLPIGLPATKENVEVLLVAVRPSNTYKSHVPRLTLTPPCDRAPVPSSCASQYCAAT